MNPGNTTSRDIPLEHLPCDLCGDSSYELLYTLDDVLMRTTRQRFQIVRCHRCRLIRMNPRPRASDLGQFYPDAYAPFRRQGLSGKARSWLYRRDVIELRRELEAPRRVVDVGAGSGELLLAVRQAGNPNVLGIDPSVDAVDIANKRYGLPMIHGTLESASLAPGSVDTVLMSHVLEHVPSPKVTIAEVARVLKPGGSAIIWVPSAQSWAASILGAHWMGWDVPRHLFTFTPSTLYRLAENAGMELASISHEWHGMEWAWGLRLAARAMAPGGVTERLIQLGHPLLAAALTPIGSMAAIAGQSGRIRVTLHKPFN